MWLENVVASTELEHLGIGHGLGDGQTLVLVVNITKLVMVVCPVQELKVLVEVGIDTHLCAQIAVHPIVDLRFNLGRFEAQCLARGAWEILVMRCGICGLGDGGNKAKHNSLLEVEHTMNSMLAWNAK